MTTAPLDVHAVRELVLFADNTAELYPQKQACIANVQRRLARGTYDPAKAVKLWRYWVDYAAIRYRVEFCCSAAVFPPAVRQAAAAEVAEREYDAILAGEYDTRP